VRDCERGWHWAYFHRADSSSIDTPVIVKVEADESQNADVEEDLPSGYQTAVAIDPVAPIARFLANSRRLRR
jgi:hypothetical protein